MIKHGSYYEDSERKKLLRSKGIRTVNLVDLSPKISANFAKSGSYYEDSEQKKAFNGSSYEESEQKCLVFSLNFAKIC